MNLEQTDKVLFITHLAVGDYTYMQNYFKAFALKYPNLKIDILVDQSRGKNLFRRWKTKSHDILFDWLESSGIFRKVYRDTNSWWQFKDTLDLLRLEKYPVVINFTTIQPHKYAKYSRYISPKGFIYALVNKPKSYQLIKKFRYFRLNKTVDVSLTYKNASKDHITNYYAEWFLALFDLKLSEQEKLPFIDIPKKWIIYGKLKHLKWGINLKNNKYSKAIFINYMAKTKKRCWSFDNVITLINDLKKIDYFYDASFIINLLPAQYEKLNCYSDNFATQRIFLFTANKSFFQLPSVILQCDLVISVETSIIHMASALKVPVVALMRQKNPEWYPYGSRYNIITTQKRSDWINKISIQDVVNQTKSFVEQVCD